MKEIEQIIKRLNDLNIESMISDALLQLEKQFIALQRGQMKAGETSEGNQIGQYTSPQYIQKRKKRGLITKHVTLHFTGGFYQSLKLEKRGNEIWIASSWDGDKWLIKRYGIDIYDLNSNSRAKLVDDIAKIVSQRIINELTK
jgi:hypothetical protein